MSTLSLEEQNNLIEAAKNPEERSSIFFNLGQNSLKFLNYSEIQLKTKDFLNFLLINQSQWVGTFLIPKEYSSRKNNPTINDIDYLIREFFSWSIFYPNEVHNMFIQDDKGNILYKDNKKQTTAFEKDKYLFTTKNENGIITKIRIKKDPDTKIGNGFTLEQKDALIKFTTSCFIEIDTPKTLTKTKSTKKTKSKS